jgi:hypothetical protein
MTFPGLWALWPFMLITLFLGGCGSGDTYPEAVLNGVKDRAIRILRTEQLDRSIAGLQGKQVELRVVEVTLASQSKERRAFLTFADGQHEYLGQLQCLAPDMPLEYVMFEIAGDQVVAIWVNETIAERPTFVTIGRPQQLASDDSMRVLSTGEVSNRVALIFISERATQLWHLLTTARVTVSGVTGYAWEATLKPPLEISSRIIKVNLP